MGLLARKADNDASWLGGRSGAMALPSISQHHSISLRCDRRFNLPPLLDAQGFFHSPNHPIASNSWASCARRHNQQSGQSLWICQSCAHQLHHLFVSQELQATTRHVPSHHHLPQAIPALQVPRRGSRDRRRCRLHPPLGEKEQEVNQVRRGQRRLGSSSPEYQLAL